MKQGQKRNIHRFALSMIALMILMGITVSLGRAGKDNSSSKNDTPNVSTSGKYGTTVTVEQLKNTLSNGFVYPEDYLNELTTTINTVNTKSTQDSLSYLFITDMHLGADDQQDDAIFRELNAAVDIVNQTDLAFLCVGGDTTDGRFAQEQGGKQRVINYWNQVTDILKRSEKPVFILKGNHDDNSFAAQKDDAALSDPNIVLNNQEWYQLTMADFNQYTTDYQNGYYYYDLPGKNVRVVCMNMSDSDDSIVDGQRAEIGMNFYGYKQEQLEWLLNDALTKENCEYIFLCHDGFEYPSGYTENSNRDTLKKILLAASSNSYFDSDNSNDHAGQEHLTRDFSDWTGKIELYHYGHYHHERTLIDYTFNKLPLFTTESARIFHYSNSQSNSVINPTSGSYWKIPDRELNTIREAAFDIVIMNQDKFDFIRFGDGEDWQISR